MSGAVEEGRQTESMAPNDRESFGTLLRRYRLTAGLSQEALAERAGLSTYAISYLESGHRSSPRAKTVALLATALALGPTEQARLSAAGQPARSAASTTTASPPRPPALPTMLTPLIGRARLEAAVVRLLGQAETRLLTLTGPGGVGKTRLALAVAAAVQDSYADGVIFVDLAALHDATLVAATVARALGLREAGAQSWRDLLLAYLRTKQLLLVLDNFEQVVDAALLVAELVAGCPRLVTLVTSRMPLWVHAEHQFPVPPLETPPPGQHTDVDAVAAYAATQLFVVRARAVAPAFALSVENAAAVAGLCQRLDGLPLAIELAAARVALLPPQALLRRVEHRLALLAGGARDVPARQQTMRATIAWSYSLLPPEEQGLFRSLGVFAGGCTIEAVERVCDPAHRLDVVEGLSALIHKSMLYREDGGKNAPRLSLLETLRAYALEQLEATGEDEALRQAHAAYYLALAEAAAPRLRETETAVWLDRVAREHANLRAALTWAWERGQGALGLRLAVALWPFWLIRGYLSEGRLWLERLLAIDGGPSAAPGAVRAEALTGAAWLAQPQHDYAASIPWLEESVALRHSLGLPDGLTDLLVHRALQARAQGDYARAVGLLEESVARHRAQGNRAGIASRGLGLALFRLGMVWREQGDLARAIPYYEECLALHHDLGEHEGIATALLGMGDIARDRGDSERVYAYCEESYAIFAELGDRWGMGVSLNNLALAAYGQGDLERAGALAERSLTLLRDLGSEPSIAEALLTLSRIAAARGDAARAAGALSESLSLVRVRGPQFLVPLALEALAALAASQEQALVAARLLGAAAGLRGAIGAAVPLVYRPAQEQTLAMVRAALDPATFTAAWTAGQAMPPEHAVAEALTFPGAAPGRGHGGDTRIDKPSGDS